MTETPASTTGSRPSDKGDGPADAAAETGGELSFGLPLDPLPPPVTVSRKAAPEGRRRVLVIEDNSDAAEGLRDALEFAEHTVEIAPDGPEGLKTARVFEPDVVLCDIGLPRMDGYAVAQAFRADEALCSIHLVALSGYTMPADIARAKAAGFDRHLAKPPTLAQINAVIASAPRRKPHDDP